MSVIAKVHCYITVRLFSVANFSNVDLAELSWFTIYTRVSVECKRFRSLWHLLVPYTSVPNPQHSLQSESFLGNPYYSILYLHNNDTIGTFEGFIQSGTAKFDSVRLLLSTLTMAGPNLEVFKFGLYLFVPVFALLHFGDPDWYHRNVLPVGIYLSCSLFTLLTLWVSSTKKSCFLLKKRLTA